VAQGTLGRDITLNLGSVACLLSHVTLWKQILEHENGEVRFPLDRDVRTARVVDELEARQSRTRDVLPVDDAVANDVEQRVRILE
jgi:hypothetical protein